MALLNVILLVGVLLLGSSTCNMDTSTIKCLTNALYHEARGEPVKGVVAVAHVILNRAKSQKFPSSVCAVVYQPKQFSFVGSLNIRDEETYLVLDKIAKEVYDGNIPDPTDGAMWYHSKNVHPYWAKRGTGETIGNHIFYRSIKNAT